MKIDNKLFQSIKISNEISNFILIPNIIQLINNLNKKLNFKVDEDIIISIKFGKRIVINCKNSNLKHIKPEDFIEIVDYNPVKKIFLSIGPNQPDFDMTFHWLVQNARKEINILVQLKSNLLINNIKYNNLKNEKQINDKAIEIAKDILIKFRTDNPIYLEKYGLFVIGNSFNDIEKIINNLMRKLNDS